VATSPPGLNHIRARVPPRPRRPRATHYRPPRRSAAPPLTAPRCPFARRAEAGGRWPTPRGGASQQARWLMLPRDLGRLAERPGRAALRNERARASVRLARSVLVRCGRLFLGPRRARSPGESSSPSLPAPRNPQCPVAWIRAVSASLLRFHRRGSDTGSDPRKPTPVPRPERACAEGCLRHLLVARSGSQPGSASRGAVGRQRRTAGSASSAWRPGCCVDVPGIARQVA
jgi:hypothetical protein